GPVRPAGRHRDRLRDPAALVRPARPAPALRDRHLHGDPLLAGPQGRRHLRAAVRSEGNMTEIPEHLRKRAEEARKKAEAAAGTGGDDAAASGGEAPAGGDAPASEAESRIPAHLLERSRAAKERAAGGGAAVAAADAPTAPAGGGTAVA